MVHVTDLSIAFMIVSGLASLSLVAFAVNGYLRTRDARMAVVAAAFSLFTIKSFLVGYSLWSRFIEHEALELVDAVGDLGTIVLLLIPLFWRAR